MNQDLYDISPPLDGLYAVWPSDTPLSQKSKLKLEKGHSVNLSSFEATAHLGSHANSPLMTDPKGLSIGEESLTKFIGPCQVIEVNVEKGAKIMPDQLPVKLEASRILFKTATADRLHPFVEDYAALDPSTIEHLHKNGVVLVGIDTPGIDLFKDCQHVLSQKCASKYKMAVLECLYLKDVPQGVYELVALPLKLIGFEASPVRAILKK